MTYWQRWLRIALGIFVVVFAAGVYLAMRRSPPPRLAKPVKRIDPGAQVQVGRGHMDVFKGGKLDVGLDYDTVLEYAGDTTKVLGVKATFPQRNGRDLEVTANKGSIARDQSSFAVSGNVKFTTSDGLVLTTEDASYTQAEGIVRAPGKVNFTKGATKGSGIGMTYDQQRDVLSLLDKVALTSEEAGGQPPSQVHAGSGVWARAEKNMRFERDVTIDRRGQTLQADTALMDLTEDDQRVRLLELHGNSRITTNPGAAAGSTPAGSSLRGMKARDITLIYGDTGEALQQGTLAGESSVDIASSGGGVTRVTGEFVDFKFEADGATLQSLGARGAHPGQVAELQLPPQAGSPPRVIRADAIQGPAPGVAAPPGGGLHSLRFTGNVEYRETPPPPGSPRLATSRALDLLMRGDFGTLDEARFSDNAMLKEGDSIQATARNARYDVGRGTFEFTGADEKGRQPEAKDQQQAVIQGARIVVTPEGRVVQAWGAVRTVLLPAQKGTNGSRTPAILSQDQPVYATSDELAYTGSSSRATFTSRTQSRLWQPQTGSQGGTAISAQVIHVDNTTGDLTAKGNVVSVMALSEAGDAVQSKRPVTTVNAGELNYEDAKRRATYVGKVTMDRRDEGTTLKADRVVVNLSNDGGALETLDGYGGVEVQDQGTPTTGARVATGDRLHYVASDAHYEITGKLVKIDEKCFGETIGRTLTFYRSVDRMIVDGNTERRTQTKGGQGCPKEPRFD